MAVTPNYSWPVPVDTDYVKDGAEAIKDLGDAVDGSLAYMPQNNQVGTTYTFTLSDVTKLVTASNAAASTYTIPPQASVVWVANTILKVTNLGAGVVTFAAGAGVTVTNTAQTLAQYATANLIRTASNAWTVVPASGGASGLTLINTTTVTAQSTVSFNNVFSATYDNYLILATYTVGADTDMNFRLRVGGADASAANYITIINDNNGANSAARLTGQTSTRIGPARNGVVMRSRADIFSPSLAVSTTLMARTVSVPVDNQIGGSQDAATAYDGFTLYPGSSTITGTIRIYGYKS